MYTYEVIDPRPASREAMKAALVKPTLGIEVTIPELASLCSLGNIDPQHSGGGDATTAAIEVALTCDVPPAGTQLATVRPDPDAIGAMAIIAMRAEGVSITPDMHNRVERLAAYDTFANGPWPGPQAIEEVDWVFEALGRMMANFKVALEERVAQMRQWLDEGDIPGIDAAMHAAQQERRTAESESDVTVVGSIAVVVSTHRAATSIGYAVAPVVVATNPEMRLGGGDPHRKHTICQYALGYVDLAAVRDALNEMEEGWGGSPTIVGSPQGVASALTTEEVAAVVAMHLRA